MAAERRHSTELKLRLVKSYPNGDCGARPKPFWMSSTNNPTRTS